MGADTFVTPAGSQRTAKRARVLLAAKLQTPAGTLDVRLRDLSRKGALVECMNIPPAGTEVKFERGKMTVPARVAWSAAGRVGLEFEYLIDESELLVHIGPAKETPAVNLRYSRSTITLGMSARERKMAQAWSVAVGLNLPERGD